MKRKKRVLRSINYNAGNIKWYQKQLLAEVREMSAEVRREVLRAIRSNPLAQDSLAMDASPVEFIKRVLDALARKWVDKFINRAIPLSSDFINRTTGAVDRDLLAAARKEGMTINYQWTDAMIERRDLIIAENVSLIRSIPEKYFTEVEGMVYRSLSRGGSLKQLSDEIERNFSKRHGITRRRCEFIARDQTRKATSALSAVRQMAAGITEGEWMHSGGGSKPRHSHVKAGRDKKRFDLSKGCLIDGEYIMPGQLPNCRCSWRPVLPF